MCCSNVFPSPVMVHHSKTEVKCRRIEMPVCNLLSLLQTAYNYDIRASHSSLGGTRVILRLCLCYVWSALRIEKYLARSN